MVNKIKSAFTLAEVLITLVVIGVVAALTIPTAVSKYRKTTVITRLKASYSTLSNAVRLSIAANGDIAGWDYDNFDNFLDKYFLPYIRNAKKSTDTNSSQIILANGTVWKITRKTNNTYSQYTSWVGYWYIHIQADINGDAKPNKIGYDRFDFYILPYAAAYYNSGSDHIAVNVPSPGVYYDGYGIGNNNLKNSSYRGCKPNCDSSSLCNSYCIGRIIRNNWRIPDDYPFEF